MLRGLWSVIGSLAWVARATKPDLAYRVNAPSSVLRQLYRRDSREANRVVALAPNDPNRSNYNLPGPLTMATQQVGSRNLLRCFIRS